MKHTSFRLLAGTVAVAVAALGMALPAAAIAASPAGAASPQVGSTQATYDVSAFIDGHSQLVMSGGSAYWYHLDYAAPGMWPEDSNYPTYINGTAWTPTWPGGVGRNDSCHCDSSTFTSVAPPVPAQITGLTYTPIASGGGCRDACSASYANGTLTIDFNDDPSGGAVWYEIEVTVTSVTPNLTMGPQAMEGNLQVSPGETLQAGYDLTIPGSHPDINVAVLSPWVTFQASCVSGQGGGQIVVTTPDATYSDPAGSSNWFPSGDQSNPVVYEGQVVVPDLCGGGTMTLRAGGTFTALVESSNPSHQVHFRWHYSAGGSAGGWSGTASVTPGQLGGGTTT